ncbi:MAG TPA: efflux RND transporter periplasmic adaptor subunit [Terriglobales bacterium]|nr:efflux RND transporter periplasmic adaptor subunit [Terriglobales bacterium]
MSFLKHKWLLGFALLLAIALIVGFTYNRAPQSQYFTAKAQRGTINDVVQATGTINAVITVQVGSQVSGTISKLYADFNSRVRQGQVVAQIEPSLFEGALLQAKADLQNARANLAAAQAELEKAKATAVQTKADYQRTVGLAKEGVMSPQQLDLARANADTAAAGVTAAEATVKQSAAQVNLKTAAVDVAQTNLDHTIIHAPINGIVVARNVDVGQTVAASLQAPTLFNIAQDLTKMQVDTQTDESDVGNIKVGQQATFNVDAFPNEIFHGHVVQIRLNPTIVQNVVTYDTVIAFDNPQMKLFPGMTAYVTIPVATAEDVLEVPNTALRFKPAMSAERIRQLYAQYGIPEQHTGPAARAGNGGPGKPQTAGLQGPRTPRRDLAVIWKLRPDRSIEPVMIRTGITDHTQTAVAELLKGSLQPGDELAIGEESAARRPGGPGMMRR